VWVDVDAVWVDVDAVWGRMLMRCGWMLMRCGWMLLVMRCAVEMLYYFVIFKIIQGENTR